MSRRFDLDEDLQEYERDHGAAGLDPDHWTNIPETLKRAGFLQWSADADAPRRPHREGDFGVSWSDPDAWLSTDEAISSSERKKPWGIGYVNGANNDDHDRGHRGTIDIDGAIAPDGRLREWVPSLEPFFARGAYIEFSPSLAEGGDVGLHIPINEFERPSWWSDSEVSDAEHQGVDVLANKFTTATGRRVPDAGEEVVEYGEWVDEWLKEAYRNIRDEDPESGADEDTSTLSEALEEETDADPSEEYPDPTREQVEDALEHVGHAAEGGDPLAYTEWRDVAFAVYTWDSGEDGREVFEQWSKQSPKWDSESADHVDEFWSGTDDAGARQGNISIGTLFYKASQNGWNTDESAVELSPKAKWASWAYRRRQDELGPDSVIPEDALEYIAREHHLYGFQALPEDVEELPPKAHNQALWWVNTRWPEEEDVDVRTDDNDNVTSRGYKSRDAGVFCWEDVRYIYADDLSKGRQAARRLLTGKYDFMTVAGTETLQVYDPETGVFNDETGPINAEIYDGLGEFWSTHELNEITAGLRQTSVVQPRELDAGDREAPLVCVKNGVLNLLTRDLHDHGPEYRFTSQLPVAYDPDADTDPYEEFVDELVGRDADRKALFEMVGHALMPDANERYKNFLILTGDADNGKSQFYARVSALLNGPAGEENNTSSVKLAKLAQNRFSIHSMYGSMANIAGEIDGKKIRNTANLKDITGGDQVEIEPKGQQSIFDTINTTLMFAANDPPILGERDKKAIATRIVPVELPYKFVDNPTESREKERTPEHVLEEELETPEALSGFLKLALDGIDRLEANHGDVSLPETPEERLTMYERTADPMREFAEECLANDPDDYIVKADVTTLYKEFATQEGYEVGSSVESVLHDVLRGAQHINYTESRPRDPDYSDTSLPLRSWDSRKRIISRLTLTERGRDLAEDAGITADPTADTAGEPEALAAREPQYGATLRATVKTVNGGEYTRKAQGRLAGSHGTYIGYIVPGGADVQLDAYEGDTVRLESVTLRTDEDGLLKAVIDDGVTIDREEEEATDDTDTDPSPDTATDAATSAATDGGEAVQVKELVQNLLADEVVTEPITPAVVAGKIDASPATVEYVLESLANRKQPLITPTEGGEYRYL